MNCNKMRFKNLVILIMMIGSVKALCPTLHCWRGQILTSNPSDECTLTVNGYPVDIDTVMRRRFYGLIRLSCPDCERVLVSKFTSCEDCDLCPHNEAIEECHAKLAPGIILLVILLSFLFVSVLALWLMKRTKCFNGFVFRIKRKNEEKKNKIRLAKAKKYQEHLELLEVDKNQTELSEPLNRIQVNNLPAVHFLLVMLLCIKQVYCCSETLIVTSEGVIQRAGNRSTIFTGLSTLTNQEELCLIHPDGSQDILILLEMIRSQHFAPIYKTCSFSVNVSSHHRCLGAGECWYQEDCNDVNIHPILGGKPKSGKFGCNLIPNICSDKCTHETQCVWWKWELNPNYNDCGTVYQLVESNVRARFSFKSSLGEVIPFEISESSHAVTNPIRLQLVSMNSKAHHMQTTLLKIGQTLISTPASDINFGISSHVGDLQVALKGGAFNYPLWDISCTYNGCERSCSAPESGFIRVKPYMQTNALAYQDVKGGILINKKVYGSVSFLTSFKEKPIQFIAEAECQFRIVTAYGCTSCLENPVIIFQAVNIITSGLMKFTSNCSTFYNEIPCSPDPQVLELEESQEVCSFTFNNVTLITPISYIFRGDILKQGIQVFNTNDISSKSKLIFSNPYFKTGFSYLTGTLFGTSFVYTVFRIIMVVKAVDIGSKIIK